jgi:hypothetical protein
MIFVKITQPRKTKLFQDRLKRGNNANNVIGIEDCSNWEVLRKCFKKIETKQNENKYRNCAVIKNHCTLAVNIQIPTINSCFDVKTVLILYVLLNNLNCRWNPPPPPPSSISSASSVPPLFSLTIYFSVLQVEAWPKSASRRIASEANYTKIVFVS